MPVPTFIVTTPSQVHITPFIIMILYRYTCRPSRDGQWGAVVNNEWTGIIRDILDDVADIGIAAIDVSLKRSEAVSYLQGIVSGG